MHSPLTPKAQVAPASESGLHLDVRAEFLYHMYYFLKPVFDFPINPITLLDVCLRPLAKH